MKQQSNRDAEAQDRQTLNALVASGVLRGDKIKAVLGSWDAPVLSPSASTTSDSCVRYIDASKKLGCSVGNVKRLVYNGELVPVIRANGQRASGVLASSIQAHLIASASAKYRP